ncbi:hypothetical protein L6279_02335 [Candidatus Parcubacteria bacterium]|nr:hypothetical protein [Candidatus Parcubacteria bacterium]
MKTISKLRQKRHYAERRCETAGKMLPACLIFRVRTKGTRDFQARRTITANLDYKNYAYLTCYQNGKNWYRYVRKQDIREIGKLTESYRIFCQSIKEVRSLNKRIVELLDKIAGIQTEDVKNYVKSRAERIGKKKGAK